MVCPEDWSLFSYSWEIEQPESTVQKEYYMDMFLPFSLCISLALYYMYDNIFKNGMWVNCVPDLLHYVDDYLIISLASFDPFEAIFGTIRNMCTNLSFMVNPRRSLPCSLPQMMGVDTESLCQQTCINLDCLRDIIFELQRVAKAKSVTKHAILFLVGNLHLICWMCYSSWPSYTT